MTKQKTAQVFAVTNRHLVREDFLTRLEKIAAAQPDGIILREKDLPEAAYQQLLFAAAQIVCPYGAALFAHSYWQAAQEAGVPRIHLPLPIFLDMPDSEKEFFQQIGVSIHSVTEAKLAEKKGAHYLIAGHIFPTQSKEGLSPRGLDFLAEVCRAVALPVLAIGGITEHNASLAMRQGAAGICTMSELMRCELPLEMIARLREILQKSPFTISSKNIIL